MDLHRIRTALERFPRVGQWKATQWLLYAVIAFVIVDALLIVLQVAGKLSHVSTVIVSMVIVIHLLLITWVVSTVKHSLSSITEGEEKFRKIFHRSPVAITLTLLEDGRLLDANSAYWKLTGLDPASSIGQTTVELGIWNSTEERSKFVTKLMREGALRNPEYQIKNQSGETFVTVAFYELITLHGQPTVLAMYYDITEQRKAQIALQTSEEKYRNFVERSMEGIWLLGFDHPISLDMTAEQQTTLIYQWGYIQECNDMLARMYGYESNTDMRGRRLLDLDAGETLSVINFQATLNLVRDGYRSANRETLERLRNGEFAYFLNNAVGIIENNHLVGLWGTQLNITDYKKTDEALRRSEARTRGLLNAIPDMIFELKRDGTILQFMPSGLNQPLLPPAQFINKKIVEVLPGLAEQTSFAIERALESGLVNAFEYEMVQEGENRTFEARISASGPDTVLAIVRDVSLRKWAEAERDKLIEELESKNAELERFTYTVSHDLKSPLITIRGFLGFLREDSLNGNMARLDADIQRITDATNKMQALLNDLLELSRVGRLINKPELVPFHSIVLEAVELVHGRISQGGVAVSIASDLPFVYVDHPRLVEVMQNLIDNAAKFMGTQESPRIEIGHEGFEKEMPVFFVKDNGIGIPPEFMDNIFGLFNKLDARSEGTGVGLALVKRIIEFHGGRIWVESQPGKGSTFYFTLPVAPVNDR